VPLADMPTETDAKQITAAHRDQVNADLLAFIKRNAMQGRRLLEVRFSSKDLTHY